MDGIRNVTSTSSAHDYSNKAIVDQQEFAATENKISNNDGKLLGIGFLKSPNDNTHYGMRAEYAEDYSKDNPIIKVTVARENGTDEEYYINVNNINPKNATEIEMFALCNYADANGKGTGGGFGSWQVLNYYRTNASDNGEFEMSNGTANFRGIKQDWASMVTRMRANYMGVGIYKQVLDGNKLLQLFEK